MRIGTLGRIIGVVAAAAHATLWGMLPQSLLVITMMLAGAMAAAAAWKGAHLAMYLLAFVLYVPLGFYLSLGEGAISRIGWVHLAYLLGAVMVHRGIVTAKRNGSVD